jgi:hypothetical protein
VCERAQCVGLTELIRWQCGVGWKCEALGPLAALLLCGIFVSRGARRSDCDSVSSQQFLCTTDVNQHPRARATITRLTRIFIPFCALFFALYRPPFGQLVFSRSTPLFCLLSSTREEA